jgi:hypothetical protein
MTCGSATEAVLDLARGVAMPASLRMAVERHVKDCAACAADLGRHRDLTAALRALSTEAQVWRASPEIEQRLQAAFDAARAISVPLSEPAAPAGGWAHEPVNRSLVWLPALAGRLRPALNFRLKAEATNPDLSTLSYALAIAAVVTLAVWIGSRTPRPPVPPATAAAPSRASTVPSGPPASVPAVAGVPPVDRPPASRPRRSRPMAAPVAGVRSVEFIALPGALGLPDLESGSVVRIQVPVGALPEYGVDIVPNVLTTTVEADVLVGQDGQPRAIRLVTAEEQSARDVRSKP